MPYKPKNSKSRYTIDQCTADALKCSTRTEWVKTYPRTYHYAHRRGWVAQCCVHMNYKIIPHNKKWTLEACIADAKQYKTLRAWHKTDSYNAACRQGWIKQCSVHMEVKWQPIWTLEKCQQEALKYNTKKEWCSIDYRSYDAAREHKWLSLCTGHMQPLHKPKGFWTTERIIEEAKKFRTQLEWKHNSSASHNKAKKLKIMDLCIQHMDNFESLCELDLLQAVRKNYPSAVKQRFGTPKKGQYAQQFELDIYIPELNKGIEFNGKYWHTEELLAKSRPNWPLDQIKNYHHIKREFFKARGIDYIEIQEKDWKSNPQSCIDQALQFLANSS